ncbi:zinc finger protein 395 isoform X1 [Schistocerca americana]|uniref:zinc finger protein 395 isoform X1 n=1 Tax=Schistocerca americana TaxID=7009 RepID=UPI001F4FED3B|nr:zinc finger protein 395 isoform X1 [Schistocerca americana]XP_049949378.1 zinc finger protein 395 isoform X1 [Schistocerca serialis cubense]
MSTGKRLAKRSIIGTRVCAPRDDGKYYSGVIQAVKSTGNAPDDESYYTVRFDDPGPQQRFLGEYREADLVGPGFRTVSGLTLVAGQRVYLTYNGREVSGNVITHKPRIDELLISISPPGQEALEVRKRLEEVRLLESRKSARLQDQDTDFARLADMAGDRRKAPSGSIDVPLSNGSPGPIRASARRMSSRRTWKLYVDARGGLAGTRKRRPSMSHADDAKELDFMDECMAALVLMRLSCSPHSPKMRGPSPSPGSDASGRSGTPSPPLSDAGSASGSTAALWAHLNADEGIVLDDFDDLPKRKKAIRTTVYHCTWPGCLAMTTTCAAIESHVRKAHLGRQNGPENGKDWDHEEEFYYTEVEIGLHASSPPTLSHRDMARPPYEDPEYQKQLKNGYHKAGPINIPAGNYSSSASSSPNSPLKHLKLSPRSESSFPTSTTSKLLSGSPTRKMRGETKKCRKVYGMEHRELWCTQCKWKKACTRFGD